MNKQNYVSIKIPKSLADRIKNMMGDYNYKSMTSYVSYILRRHIASYNADQDCVEITDDDEKRIKKRLEELGYL